MTSSIHDLEPQLAANRRYWTGWSSTPADPGSDLPIYRKDIAYPLLNGLLRVRDRSLDEALKQATWAPDVVVHWPSGGRPVGFLSLFEALHRAHRAG